MYLPVRTRIQVSAPTCSAASPGAGQISKKPTVFYPMPGRCMIIRGTPPGCSNEDHETNQRKAGLQNIRDGRRPRPASRCESRSQNRTCPWHAHLYLARRQGGCAKAVSELAGPVQNSNATRNRLPNPNTALQIHETPIVAAVSPDPTKCVRHVQSWTRRFNPGPKFCMPRMAQLLDGIALHILDVIF